MLTHIISEIELKYTPNKYGTAQINNLFDCVPIFRDFWNKDSIEYYEECKVMYLNRSSEILGIYHHSKGGAHAVCYDVRLIFQAALKANACSIIVVHNHPSGNLTPSPADIIMTKKLLDAGKLLDIQLLDSIILTKNSFASLITDGVVKVA